MLVIGGGVSGDNLLDHLAEDGFGVGDVVGGDESSDVIILDHVMHGTDWRGQGTWEHLEEGRTFVCISAHNTEHLVNHIKTVWDDVGKAEIVEDGNVLFAAGEERFSREKQQDGFPGKAL